jgi:hypothetical protein
MTSSRSDLTLSSRSRNDTLFSPIGQVRSGAEAAWTGIAWTRKGGEPGPTGLSHPFIMSTYALALACAAGVDR